MKLFETLLWIWINYSIQISLRVGQSSVQFYNYIEEGVMLALRDIAEQAGLSWESISMKLQQQGHPHLETC